MALFRRRPKPATPKLDEPHDCRYHEAWHSARGRAKARSVLLRESRGSQRTAERDRDRLRDDLAVARQLVDELEREAAARHGTGDVAAMLQTEPAGLAVRALHAERRATAATQRAELAEKRANRLDDDLAVERRRREELELLLTDEQRASLLPPELARAAR